MTPTPPITDLATSQNFPPRGWRADVGLTLVVAARRFELTPRAIRYYEEHGLVRPARDGKGRRIFDEIQCARLELIAALRKAEVPLGEIGRVLAAADPRLSRAIASAVLERRLLQIQALRDRAVAALDWLNAPDGVLVSSTRRSTT